ncbi:hypothetical protein HK100_000674 [Physocladia obscura]|uniref:Vesicle tethering protein Uso1/P115-like head domain-containing protein n=1 Tax=Physocladia obscura TaxID=109957 RepID=A0AAD5T0U5_9FUNG|nr:hypothetical protein HK100_000674 [Physocladia obscura]
MSFLFGALSLGNGHNSSGTGGSGGILGGGSGAEGDKSKNKEVERTVAALVERATHATLLEDRRAAVLGLKGLARDFRGLVGARAVPVLLHVLTDDRLDVEITKAALDALNTLLTPAQTPTPDPNNASTSNTANNISASLAIAVCRDPRNVALLLDILEDFEFYIRFNAIQLLATLLDATGPAFQDAVLTAPTGIARLMDLLDDPREIIRNEALLLLISLTSNNAEIQKIIAFENAFERLLGIVLAEGASEGDIIVQDCLTLTLNLLRYNISNQNLFRESSCIRQIPSLLLSHSVLQDNKGEPMPVPLTHEGNTWNPQKIINAQLILELIRILVVPNNPNTAKNQIIMNNAGILLPIIDLALCPKVHSKVRTQAFNAVGDVIRGSPANQEVLGKYVVMPSKKDTTQIPISAILCLVQTALIGDHFDLRAAGAYCFQSFVYNNQENQLALAATLTPPPFDMNEEDDQPQSPGSLIISSILNWQKTRTDPYRTWFATILLSHIVAENPRCQEMALSVKIDDSDSDEPISLLHKVVYALLVATTRENADIRIVLGILSLIATWLFASSHAVKEFLSEGSNLQFLIEQVNASSGVDPLVQGMAAFIISICHEYNDNTEASFTQASLQALIVSRIGGGVFVSRIDRLKDSKYFQKAALNFTSENSENLPDVYFDIAFVELLKSSCEPMIRSVINPKIRENAAKKSAEYAELQSLVDSYKLQVAQQEYEISECKNILAQTEMYHRDEVSKLQAEIESLKAKLNKQTPTDQLPPRPRSPNTSSTSSADASSSFAKINSLQVDLQLKTQAYDLLAQEQDDLLVCLAESDITIRGLKDRLRALGQVVESDDDEEDEEDDNGDGEE